MAREAGGTLGKDGGAYYTWYNRAERTNGETGTYNPSVRKYKDALLM